MNDLAAVELFMLSSKIGAIIIDGCINYISETKLKDASSVLGETYYSEIFDNEKDHNVAHKGDYISRFPLNAGMTYLKHNEALAREEIEEISSVCEHHTKLFTAANDCLKEMVDQLSAFKRDLS